MLTTSEYLLIASVCPLSCAPSFGFVLLKGCFPLVATEGTRLSAHSAHRRAKRRGALVAERKVVRMGCRETMKRRGGNFDRRFHRRLGMESKSRLTLHSGERNQIFVQRE